MKSGGWGGDDDASKIREHMWRHGSALPIALVKDAATELSHPLLNAQQNRVFVVVSQDCDVANLSLQIEPSMEIIVGTITRSANGSYLFNKSVRRSHVRCRHDGIPAIAEFR